MPVEGTNFINAIGLSARQQQGRATTGLGHRMQRQRRGRVHLANI